MTVYIRRVDETATLAICHQLATLAAQQEIKEHTNVPGMTPHGKQAGLRWRIPPPASGAHALDACIIIER